MNRERIEAHTLRLERERELLLIQFYSMESAVAKMQSNLDLIESIQAFTPLTVKK